MSSGIFKDLTGKIFGRLTVKHRIPNKFGKVYWECQCECGNISEVRGDSFNQKNPNTSSCGCLQKDAARKNGKKSRKPSGVKVIGDLFSNYRRRAKNNNIEWSLTKEQFIDFIFGPCNYCNVANSNKASHPRISEDIVPYNGIDRVNSELGYYIENCVSCCNQCNYGKLDFSEQEFYDWIGRLHSNLVLKGVLNV